MHKVSQELVTVLVQDCLQASANMPFTAQYSAGLKERPGKYAKYWYLGLRVCIVGC